MHEGLAPSDWVLRWLHLLPPGATALDVACGSGRHFRLLAERGFRVTGIDRDAEAVRPLQALGEVVVADVEGGPWPLAGRRFDLVLVTNYLWRPLAPTLLAAVAEGGWYLHETFAAGHETIGRPSRPDFLLHPGELLEITRGLRVVAFEDGFLDGPERFVQRIVARREPESPAAPLRHRLRGPEPGG